MPQISSSWVGPDLEDRFTPIFRLLYVPLKKKKSLAPKDLSKSYSGLAFFTPSDVLRI